MTEVVAALITDGDRFLICQRPANKSRAFLWEFPGGKIEPGETPERALERECLEELAVHTETGALYAENVCEYPDVTIRLRLYKSRVVSGTVTALEHLAVAWIGRGELSGYTFCPADIPFAEKIFKFGL